MSQRKVREFLLKNKGKGYTIKQLAEELSLCYSSVYSNCKRLIRSGFIKCRYLSPTNKRFYYIEDENTEKKL